MLKKDSYLLGVGIALASMLITAGLLLLGLFIFSKTFSDDPKLFLFSFIPTALILRWYTKLRLMKTVITIIIVLMLCVIFYFYYLYSIGMFINNHIQL